MPAKKRRSTGKTTRKAPAMRNFGLIGWTFWTRGTGKALRGDKDAQLLAIYLSTCQNANTIGLYYIPIVTIAHEIGLTIDETEKALARALQEGFALYERGSETVFVRSLARIRLGLEPGGRIQENDNRHASIIRLMHEVDNPAMLQAFWDEYHETLRLPEPWWNEPLASPFPSPLQAPCKQEAESRKQKAEEERSGFFFSDDENGGLKLAPVDAAPPSDAQTIFGAYLEGWERVVGGKRPPVLDAKRKQLVKARLKEFSVDDLVLAAKGVWESPWHVTNRQTAFDLVMRDTKHVEQFIDYANVRRTGDDSLPEYHTHSPDTSAEELLSDEEYRKIREREEREFAERQARLARS